MPVVRTEVEVEAPADRVWRVVSDPRYLPRWDRHVVAVRGVPSDGLEVGSRYTSDVRFMGVTAHIYATVLELEPSHCAKIRLTGVLEGLVETTLEPMSEARTRLVQRVEYRFVGGPLGAFAAGAVQSLGGASALRRGVLAQKLQAEQGG